MHVAWTWFYRLMLNVNSVIYFYGKHLLSFVARTYNFSSSSAGFHRTNGCSCICVCVYGKKIYEEIRRFRHSNKTWIKLIIFISVLFIFLYLSRIRYIKRHLLKNVSFFSALETGFFLFVLAKCFCFVPLPNSKNLSRKFCGSKVLFFFRSPYSFPILRVNFFFLSFSWYSVFTLRFSEYGNRRFFAQVILFYLKKCGLVRAISMLCLFSKLIYIVAKWPLLHSSVKINWYLKNKFKRHKVSFLWQRNMLKLRFMSIATSI